MRLRYGINPHQPARLVVPAGHPFRVLAGDLSAINVLDALTGWQLVTDAAAATGRPAAASIKHLSPAGAALCGGVDAVIRETFDVETEPGPITAAYLRAREADSGPRCLGRDHRAGLRPRRRGAAGAEETLDVHCV